MQMQRNGRSDMESGQAKDGPAVERKPAAFTVTANGHAICQGAHVTAHNHPFDAPHLPRRWFSPGVTFAACAEFLEEAMRRGDTVDVVVDVAFRDEPEQERCRVVALEHDGERPSLLKFAGNRWWFEFDAAPAKNVAEPAESLDELQTRVDDLEQRLEVLEGMLNP